MTWESYDETDHVWQAGMGKHKNEQRRENH